MLVRVECAGEVRVAGFSKENSIFSLPKGKNPVWELSSYGTVARRVCYSDGSEFVALPEEVRKISENYCCQQTALLLFLADSVGKGSKKRLLFVPGFGRFDLLKCEKRINELLSGLGKEAFPYGIYADPSARVVYVVKKVSLTEGQLPLVWNLLTECGYATSSVLLCNRHSPKDGLLCFRQGNSLTKEKVLLQQMELDDLAKMIITGSSVSCWA